MGDITRRCGECGTDRVFDHPVCLDGHGDDCPEWMCRRCGAALIFEFVVEVVRRPVPAVRAA